MTRKQVLKGIEKQEITPLKGYQTLYTKPRVDRATFCKIKMNLNNESVGVNRFMKFIFLLPMPIFMLQFFLGFVKNKTGEFDIGELKKLLVYMGGTVIQVQDAKKEVDINIRIY
ncbi:MAG TPA: hypothetical protein PLR26_07850 [Bacilli bacterium]|nr:hypothetical protein [Bacilli bacterium]